MILSVIICTHNPRRDYLERTLKALKAQTFLLEKWELLVIDNASSLPLAAELDLSWHPQARVVLETELGILPARVRGLQEAKADLMLFVDDDNVLAPDYLENAIEIADTHPFLGVWGGNISPEFETPPPRWINEYMQLLARVEVPEDRWSNLRFVYATVPPTAGMCLRRAVAGAFIQVVKTDSRRQHLGRRGKAGLTNGEDGDLALTACDIGLGTGQFSKLKMTHLIPLERCSQGYLLKLAEGTYFSGAILEALRGKFPEPYRSSPLRAFVGAWKRRLFWSHHRALLFECCLRAQRRANEVIAGWR